VLVRPVQVSLERVFASLAHHSQTSEGSATFESKFALPLWLIMFAFEKVSGIDVWIQTSYDAIEMEVASQSSRRTSRGANATTVENF